MEQDSTDHDFFQYFDPSPVLEHDTLNRFQMQIDFIPSIEKIVNNLKSNLNNAKNETDSIMYHLDLLGVDPSFKTACQSLSEMFISFADSLVSEYKSNIENRKAYIPTLLSGQREPFNKANQDFQKCVEEYGSTNPNIKANFSRESPLQTSMKQRAETFYDLCTSVKSCEELLANATATAFLSFFKATSENMKKCTEIIDAQIDKMQDSISNINAINLQPAPRKLVGDYCDTCWSIRRSPPVELSPSLEHPCGIVWVRQHRIVKIWVRRYMTLENGFLNLYDPQTGENDQNLFLGLVTFSKHQSQKRRHVFKVQTSQLLLRLQALTDFDVEQWFTIFNNHNNNVLNGVSDMPNSQSHDGQEGSQGCNEAHVCVDCGATDATWCSLNWCGYLCLKCSGIHRHLSSSKSKVRSTLLDNLSPLIYDMLTMMTNEAANRLLLAEPPTNINVGPRMDEESRQAYITNKYVNLSYALKTTQVPDPFNAIINNDYYALFHAMNFGKADELYESLTPLHAAAACGDSMIAAIAACCSDTIDVKDGNGWTPLTYAVYYDNVDIIKFLVDFGAQPQKETADLFTLVVAVGDEEVMDILLKTAHYSGFNSSSARKVFKPKTTIFASERKADLTQIVVTDDIKNLANLLYREGHTQ
ncbi:hypothetical protein M9Y10_025533 [Tritrichomonas musculus]|uniref:ARF GAP-like zinc finger-containing protein n=1 Tax=Tritrichomonas musculus TaxID=1915356 RepID=A0ABR2H9Z4_9EUKA